MMRSEILTIIDDPKQLENLYRSDKSAFKTEFNSLYPEIADNKIAAYWNERLNCESAEISWGNNKEIVFVIIASLLAGFIAKLPALLDINDESFYQRNLGFIVFPILTTYFIWRNGISAKKIVIGVAAILAAVLFINLFPENRRSDTLVLSCIHLPLFLWAVSGFAFVGENPKSLSRRLDFLRCNGDLAIISAVLVISGVLLTGITIGLFSIIGFHIEEFYIEYIAICGLAAIPIVGTYIVRTNPQLVNKVSPIVARIFSPLVLITLVAYLIAIFFSGKDPYKDREFLMIFNILLIGVMAIILFSFAESSKKSGNRTGNLILSALSIVTIIVNAIALSAISYRISEWGITPDRLAILGANLLMLINLCLVTFRLYRVVTKTANIAEVENSISMFLPVYAVWTIIVAFVFPLIFNFG